MAMNFFVTAIGGYVLRGNNPIFVKDYEMAMKLFGLQDDEYKFRPVAHTSPNVCVSCEG